MSENFREAEKASPDLSVYRSAVLEELRRHELIRLLRKFAEQQIRAVLIKGAALAYSIYPLPEQRPRSDTDLLIQETDVEPLEKILLDDGYVRFPTVQGKLVSHQLLYQKRAGEILHTLDVHWKISNPLIFSELLTYDELIAEAAAIPRLSPDAIGPSTVHSLLIACIHRIAHHHAEQREEWIRDIDLLIRQMSGDEITRFTVLAAEKKIRAVCLSGLLQAQSNFTTPIENTILNALKSHNPKHEASAAYLNNDLRRIDFLKMEFAGLPFSKRIKLIWEMLFPSPEYLSAKYPGTSSFMLPYLYFKRIAAGLTNLIIRD